MSEQNRINLEARYNVNFYLISTPSNDPWPNNN